MHLKNTTTLLALWAMPLFLLSQQASNTPVFAIGTSPLEATCAVIKNLGCSGKKRSGALKAFATGGSPPYTYQWSNGSTSELIENLGSGRYTVTVSDSGGSSTSASAILKTGQLQLSIKPGRQANIGGFADGSATVLVSGGSPPYSYQWSSGEKTATAFSLGKGKSVVTVTDKNGCRGISEVGFEKKAMPLNVMIFQSLTINCYGKETAAVQVLPEGGTPPYTYRWSDPNMKGSEPTKIPAGTYIVTVMDTRGQKSTAQTTIHQPPELIADAILEAPASLGQRDAQATVTAAGGTGQHRFKWSSGETVASATQLAPGQQSVTVMDIHDCKAVAFLKVPEKAMPLAVRILPKEAADCAGGNMALTAKTTGGEKPLRFKWSAKGAKGHTTGLLPAGQYTVTVTDAEGNTAVAGYDISKVRPIHVVATALASTLPGTANGRATVDVTGGTEHFSYLWDNGEKTQKATELSIGRHTVTVTDDVGCAATAVVEIKEKVPPLSAVISQTKKLDCANDQSAALSVKLTGGKAPFNYKWNAPSLVGSNPQGLSGGDYALTVTDAAGQQVKASVFIFEPAPLKVNLTKNTRIANKREKNGMARVSVSGGTGRYIYEWDNGATDAANFSLPLGKHWVKATDAKGCSQRLDFETKLRTIPELDVKKLRPGEVVLMKKIFFEPDSIRMSPASFPSVEELFDFLKYNENVAIEVGGHTNSIPPPDFCDSLSTARAKSVATYLIQKGIPADRITYKGYGKRKPIASNKSARGRMRNQRVEIKILRLE